MNSIKSIILIIIVTVLTVNVSCDSMDDNFKEYLELQRTYSPKIQNLTTDVGLKEVTLHWDNPESNIAKHILIEFEGDSMYFDELVDSAFIENLEIKFYTMTVYTIDAFDNRSVPVSTTVFPNGEEKN